VCIFSIELVIRLKLISNVYSIVKILTKVSHIIISSKISDHWKEKIVPVYAYIIFKNSLSILGILFLIIIMFSILVFFSSKFALLLFSIIGIVTSIIISLVYLKIREVFWSE